MNKTLGPPSTAGSRGQRRGLRAACPGSWPTSFDMHWPGHLPWLTLSAPGASRRRGRPKGTVALPASSSPRLPSAV